MRMKCNNNWSPGFSPSNIVISNFFQFVQYFHFCTTPWASAPLFWLVHEAEAEDVWRHSLRLMDTVYLLPWEQRSHNLWNEPQLGVNTTTLTRRRTKMTSDGVFFANAETELIIQLTWLAQHCSTLTEDLDGELRSSQWSVSSGPSCRKERTHSATVRFLGLCVCSRSTRALQRNCWRRSANTKVSMKEASCRAEGEQRVSVRPSPPKVWQW